MKSKDILVSEAPFQKVGNDERDTDTGLKRKHVNIEKKTSDDQDKLAVEGNSSTTTEKLAETFEKEVIDEDRRLEYGNLILGGYQYNIHGEKRNSLPANGPGVNRYGLLVMNCCAICLSSYEEMDVVVWSDKESDCQHAFHEDCMLDWMCNVQQTKDGMQNKCPLCRQNFLPNLSQYYDGKYIKKQNLTPPERTFNLNAVSLW